MPIKSITYKLRNFNSSCCIKWLKHCFEQANVSIIAMEFGFVSVNIKDNKKALEIITKAGFEILIDKNLIIIEDIKQAVYEIVYLQNNQNSIIQKADYLIEKLGMSYQNISKLFSKYNDITLEKYFIKHKIEKIKDLIESDDYTLSEIAYIMDYSSVQHLSTQFKKETGYTFTEFSQLDKKPKIDLNKL